MTIRMKIGTTVHNTSIKVVWVVFDGVGLRFSLLDWIRGYFESGGAYFDADVDTLDETGPTAISNCRSFEFRINGRR